MTYRMAWIAGCMGVLAPGLVISSLHGQGAWGNASIISKKADSVIELDPLVVSASRYEEELLRTPVSVTILNSPDLAREAAPSVVAAFRTVPGVDFQQAGINRYLIALRGFNNAFGTGAYVMVDHRDASHPTMGTVDFSRLPIDSLDLERIEIVRGPASALYGPGVEKGVIHFITKDPFEYPGASMAVGFGEQSMRQFSFRQAEIIHEKLAYKITGSYMEGNDWKLDPEIDHDMNILKAIVREVRDLNGTIVRIVEGRDYDSYAWYLAGQVQYRPDKDTRLSAYVDYGEQKNILNASLGEIQLDGPGMLNAQVQFQKGSLWVQANASREFSDGKAFFYRAGHLMYGSSYQVNVQGQYRLTWSDTEEPIIIGADYRQTTPESEGTIYGRFENDDTFTMAGGYIQGTKSLSRQLFLRGSCRVDYIDATSDTVYSPRAALVYQPTPEQSFRLTYNHANSRPTAGGFYYDLNVGMLQREGKPYALIRFMGAAIPYTFPDPPLTSSFISKGRDIGIGISTWRAYAALTPQLAENGELQVGDPAALQEFLLTKVPQIEGFSAGILYNDRNQVIQSLEGTDQVQLPKLDTVEIGYKGIWRDRIRVEMDLYYTRESDRTFNKALTPFVVVPAEILSGDLDQAVRSAFTDEELAPFGIDVETLTTAYAATGAALAGGPIGIIEPDQNYDPETLPEMVRTYFNAGDLDYFGTDLSVEVSFNPQWSAFANYSWVSDTFFDEKDLGLPGTGREVSMNSPQHKFRAGLTYDSPNGLSLSGSVHYLSSFTVRNGGYYNGTVESYTLVDLGLTYVFSGDASGLVLSITAQNILNKIHREYLGFPKIGRLVCARLSYAF